MKIEDLMRDIKNEENICEKLNDALNRMDSVHFIIKHPATKSTYDPPSGWGTDNAITKEVYEEDDILFKKFKDTYTNHLNNELKRHKEILNNLLNKKAKIEKLLSD